MKKIPRGGRSRLTMRSVPHELPGATRFSADEDDNNAYSLIHMVKGYPEIYADLITATTAPHGKGPERMAGQWALAYLTFVNSRHPNIQPWYHRARVDLDLWKECGFSGLPCYNTVYKRFTELEKLNGGMHSICRDLTARLITRARLQDNEVGRHWHIDSTEAQSNAKLHHDCQESDKQKCRWRTDLKRDRTIKMVPSGTVRALRHSEADHPIDGSKTPEVDQYRYAGPIRKVKVEGEPMNRIFYAGHWWKTRDPDASGRAYTRGNHVKAAWFGYYQTTVVDHYTGAALASVTVPANDQEHISYPDVFERALANNGGVKPFIVAGDRGYSARNVFEYNTNLGVASAFPYRRWNQTEPVHRQPTDLYDEHGVPRCQSCDGETRFLSNAIEHRILANGQEANIPRQWFTCKVPVNADCKKRQSITLTANPRYTLPLWRTEPAYLAMRVSRQLYERKHRQMRMNFLVGPDDKSIRPKRFGQAWMQLRASAAVFVEWIRVLARCGWDGSGESVVGLPRKTSDGGATHRLAQARARRRQSGGDPPPAVAA
jgi:hypothetical protein